jgi:serine/threonine protein kinase
MTVHRPGDVLAGRYRLADLLSETVHGRFWLAHDSVLGRPVAVHVIDADDPRAPALMRAARASASIPDPRLLRVLDAETRDGISYVVNEWGRGTSLDILLARSGPLPPRRSAWIASEIAATLQKAHGLGHAHGRLSPEKILIDDAGGVRIIGFAVDAALYDLPEGTAADDDLHLAALLAACLTGTWAGETESAVPATPRTGGHPMRPRQVRAGVPRALDDLCELMLNPSARGRQEGATLDARYVHDRLMEYLGDPSDVAGLPVGQRAPLAPGSITTALRVPVGNGGVADDTAARASDLEQTAAHPAPTHPSEHADIPTQASMPSFEDDDSWHLPRVTPAPPPPPLEAPEPKPLFADEPRIPREPDATQDVVPFLDEPAGEALEEPPPETLWPWTEEEPPKRRRRWLPLAFGLVALLLVVAAVLVVRDVSRDTGDTSAGSPSPSPSGAVAKPITGLRATDFDPQGDPPSEYPELARFAVDGKPTTSWNTSTYNAQLGLRPPALKSGVGLVLDLGGTYAVDSARLTVNGGPTGVSLYVTQEKPSSVADLKPAATATVEGESRPVQVDGALGRYLVVWLTSLPHVSDGYRGEVAEVAVTGTAR